jgi:hypothetical protein
MPIDTAARFIALSSNGTLETYHLSNIFRLSIETLTS